MTPDDRRRLAEVTAGWHSGHAEALAEVRRLVGEAARHGHGHGWLLDRIAELDQHPLGHRSDA